MNQQRKEHRAGTKRPHRMLHFGRRIIRWRAEVLGRLGKAPGAWLLAYLAQRFCALTAFAKSVWRK